MSYRIIFSIPGLPKGLNGSHGHPYAVAKQKRKWRRASWAYSISFKPAKPLEKCRVICTRHSTSPMDEDNIAGSFKPIIDGLRDAGIISDDKKQVIVERKYLWEKAPRGKGFVTVIVEEIES